MPRLAKSVGIVYDSTKLIDKFLNSMHPQSKYAPLILNFQTQRRNEELSNNYTHKLLSMGEVEMALLAMDENTQSTRN